MLRLDLTARQADQLLDFIALLAQWNKTYNLTSIRTVEGMLSHHVVDCLAIVPPLRRSQGVATRLLDVGSGGGLPGLVIAVMDPSTQVTCVDSVGKKMAFVQQAASTLGLRNLSAVHARVETMHAGPFDVITSRAFSSLREFTARTEPLLAWDGVWLAMKGKPPEDEIAELPGDIDMFHVEPVLSPEAVGERCIVWMRRKSQQ